MSPSTQTRHVVVTLHAWAARSRRAWVTVEVAQAGGSFIEIARLESGPGAASDLIVPLSFSVPPRGRYRFVQSGNDGAVEQILSHVYSEM